MDRQFFNPHDVLQRYVIDPFSDAVSSRNSDIHAVNPYQDLIGVMDFVRLATGNVQAQRHEGFCSDQLQKFLGKHP